jgi:quercetin dioxygenase-like cupin family protein
VTIFRGASAPLGPADPRTFTGPAQVARLAADERVTSVHVYRVVFEAGGRTHWHTHSGPQWLLIVEGRIRVQVAGEGAVDVDAGDAVVIPPGEKHWHGAVPGERGAHLAVNVNVTTEWLEPVSDRDYAESGA